MKDTPSDNVKGELAKKHIKLWFRPKDESEGNKFDRRFEEFQKKYSPPSGFWIFAAWILSIKSLKDLSIEQRKRYQEESKFIKYLIDGKRAVFSDFLNSLKEAESFKLISPIENTFMQGMINLIKREIELKRTKNPDIKNHPEKPITVCSNILMFGIDNYWKRGRPNHSKSARLVYDFLTLLYPNEELNKETIRRSYLGMQKGV